MPRRFPPPWTIEENNNACFIVRDKSGQALAYVYFEDEPGRRTAASLLTRDEARRIAANSKRLKSARRAIAAKAGIRQAFSASMGESHEHKTAAVTQPRPHP